MSAQGTPGILAESLKGRATWAGIGVARLCHQPPLQTKAHVGSQLTLLWGDLAKGIYPSPCSLGKPHSMIPNDTNAVVQEVKDITIRSGLSKWTLN
jgi:hypothetical protein